MKALQALQQRGDIVFGAESTTEAFGPKVATVATADLLTAAQQGIDVVAQPDGKSWQLSREKRHYHLRVNPASLDSPEMETLRRVFHLSPKGDHFEVTVEETQPFASATSDQLDLETRSLLQALYFVSHGVNVPAARPTRTSRWSTRATASSSTPPTTTPAPPSRS